MASTRRLFALFASLVISSSAWGDQPDDPLAQRRTVAVSNRQVLRAIALWIPADVVCDVLVEEADLNGSTTAGLDHFERRARKMLDAKCFVYCPNRESAAEAIFRERLANHGVPILRVPSPRTLFDSASSIDLYSRALLISVE